MPKKDLKVEIHLKQVDDTGFSLKTSGTAKDLGEAIMSLHAWFITENVEPSSQSDYLLYVLESLNRKNKKEAIKAVEVDLKELLKQMGGKE